MKTGKYSLFQLFNNPEIEQIIIPEIQRDYVWGEDNVTGLLNSIIDKFELKENVDFSVMVDKKPVPDSISEYLSQEYSKLRYSAKIGFIYAYHDPDYAGKFFLIDGQQRITTLYLLLIAIYKRQKDKWSYFKEVYFPQELPKLDYRVREITHDYLIDLIRNEFSDERKDFRMQNSFYGILYDRDITTSSMARNYECINSLIDKRISDEDIAGFTQYIEHFIEFNFFDTNISAQGERLYIYMNSRGESLSYQENMKSILVGKCDVDKKYVFGKAWENWQDFYWNNRGSKINADFGLEKFIKWSVVLHICSNENVNLKPKEIVKAGKKQSEIEVIEDYIRVEQSMGSRKRQFDNYIKNYIKENDTYNYEWLICVQKAVERLNEMIKEDEQLFVSDDWLYNSESAIDYIVQLSAIRYLMRFESASTKDLRSICYYLKNKTYDDTHHKNPDRATILAIKMINEMPDSGKLYDKEDYHNFYGNTDKMMLEKIRDEEMRADWETEFFKFVDDEALEEFLKGDCFCILRQSSTPEVFGMYRQLFKDKLMNRRNDEGKVLRKELLHYGDISVDEGGGSANLTSRWFHRYNWISDDSDWRKKFNNQHFVDSILHPFLDNAPYPDSRNEWYEIFLNEEVNLFVGDYRFLCDDHTYKMILLDGKQAGKDKSKHLEIALLHGMFRECGVWIYEFDICVVPFKVENGEFVVSQKDDRYFVDICYEWHYDRICQWRLTIGRRGEFEAISDFSEEYKLTESGRLTKLFYDDDATLNVMENVKEVKRRFDVLRPEIAKIAETSFVPKKDESQSSQLSQ